MIAPAQSELNHCGCCAGIGVETPVALYNRPGLSAIAYRTGNYTSFRNTSLARLSDGRWPVLRQLRTRENDDFTIALLDAWAVVGDVLTFYQERIANESYLRTATERRSILEQSRLIGYQLSAGLAANAYLAFTMEEAPGAPQQSAQPLQLPAGTRVQSVPGPDEQPQVFETVEAIEARVEWNAILPQLTEPQTLTWDMKRLWLAGANLTLAVGDALLIIADEGGSKLPSLLRVAKVTSDAAAGRTGVTLEKISPEPKDPVTAERPAVFAMRVSAAPFGHNAPLQSSFDPDGKYIPIEWDLEGESPNALALNSRQDKILPNSWAVIERGDNSGRVWTFAVVQGVTHKSMAKYGIAGSATLLTFDKNVWEPDHAKLSLARQITIAAQSEELVAAELPLAYPVYGSTVKLQDRIEGLAAGRPLAVSGKRQRLRIKNPAAASFPKQNSRLDIPVFGGFPDVPLPDIPDIEIPPTLVLDLGNVLTLAAPPAKLGNSLSTALSPGGFGAALTEEPPPTLILDIIDRNGISGRIEISAGEIDLVAAADNDETVREIVFIQDNPTTAITHFMNRTTVQLSAPLGNVYERATLRINANVAAATHGEAVKELLGSGDATVPYQSFTLRQPPLTYISAETPSGAASTLKIYVNDVLWQEAPFFYGRGADERIYVLRQDDDGRTSVQFGDGINGARLPTGQNNVRAEYRKGSGLAGLVAAGQISQLISRPLGLKDVINPEAANGAEDPEQRDPARQNAPLTVLTLDRAVSLQDYEDFSRTFGGIAKAQAAWVWDGRKRTVFITVAGPDGAAIDETGAVVTRLKEALRAYGDPFVAFTIRNFRRALFQIHGNVTVAADHPVETVLDAVRAVLLDRYSFANRSFGQSVALSETIAIIQSVPGVIAVDVDEFYRNDTPAPKWSPRLRADSPAMGADGAVHAAELLLLDETSLARLGATR